MNDLYGVWDPVHTTGYEVEGASRNDWDRDLDLVSNMEDYNRLEFLEEGVYNTYYYYNGWRNDVVKGKWSVTGNYLYAENDETSGRQKIVKLASDGLILEVHERATTDAGAPAEYYEKTTYRKVTQ